MREEKKYWAKTWESSKLQLHNVVDEFPSPWKIIGGTRARVCSHAGRSKKNSAGYHQTIR